jgi:hypothetical protein
MQFSRRRLTDIDRVRVAERKLVPIVAGSPKMPGFLLVEVRAAREVEGKSRGSRGEVEGKSS